MQRQILIGTICFLSSVAHAQAATPALLPPLATPAEMAAAPQVKATKPAPETMRVPVLKSALQRGETITEDNVTMVEVPTSQVFASTLTSAAELVGQEAVRPLAAGKAINKLHVRIAPLISRNQLVTLIYKRGGVTLTGTAQALEDGQAGQTIRIVNPSTRSTLNGVVGKDGSVEVN